MRRKNDDRFITGLDQVLSARPSWWSQRLGLLANQASVTREGDYAWTALAERGAKLKCVFSPQHGLWAEEQANMVESDHGRLTDPPIPVYSLYGETRTPSGPMLEGLERFIVDLQDVGTRVYTFVWTLRHCLMACAEHNVAVTILDRPNPLGRVIIEGPILDSRFKSFVGEAPIPMRHGLTLAELARWIVRYESLPLELDVIPVRHWDDSALLAQMWPLQQWIPPSPNMPTPFTSLFYAGMVLLEGTNLSEGRGTTRPFEVVGAPFIDGHRLANDMQSLELPGVAFRPVRFRPTFDKWQGECCSGCRLDVRDPVRFRPYRTAIALLATIATCWPDHFRWLPPPYEYETKKWPIDIISGSDQLRITLSGPIGDIGEIAQRLSQVDERAWKETCRDRVIYGQGACRWDG